MLVGNVVSKFKSNSLKISNLDTLKAVPCRNFERASIKRKNENNVTHFVPTVIEINNNAVLCLRILEPQ